MKSLKLGYNNNAWARIEMGYSGSDIEIDHALMKRNFASSSLIALLMSLSAFAEGTNDFRVKNVGVGMSESEFLKIQKNATTNADKSVPKLEIKVYVLTDDLNSEFTFLDGTCQV